MAAIVEQPSSAYQFRTFIVHKPVDVVSSTIDTGPTELIKKKNHPRFGLPVNSKGRKTVYEIAKEAGFPTDCGLVGRLDLETSGIMVGHDKPSTNHNMHEVMKSLSQRIHVE
jgi:16S rRNA U516 pseudouridylate synthase RsuA-like enzyme